jgi:hypothetical protein
MSTNVDWLSVIQGPEVPASIRRIISKADEAFSQGESTPSVPEELRSLEAEVSLNLYDYLRVSSGSHASLLQRRLVFALQNDKPVDQCFRVFENLSRVGFASPVEKATIVILVLRYLNAKLTPFELKPLVEAMVDELETCRVGCEENLSILNTFLKAPPDVPTQATS